MFSFFKSYYVGDTAFILLSRGEVIASKLIVSLSTFWSDYSHWYEKGEDSKTEAIHFPRLDRNHRLLIWRTSKSTPTALCPLHQVQILRILLRAGTQ
jgi:hypothetical protein